MSLRRREYLTEDILTKKWITGVEKWWKQWINDLEKKVDTPWDKHGMSPNVIEAWKEYLRDGQKRVMRIKEHAIFRKGLWTQTVGNRKDDFATVMEIPLAGTDKKLEFKGLSRLTYKLQDVAEYFEGQLDAASPSDFRLTAVNYEMMKHAKNSQEFEEWEEHWEGVIGEDGDEFIKKVNKTMTDDVFKLLYKLEKDVISKLKQHAKKKKVEQEYPFEEYDTELSIGKLKIKFDLGEWTYQPTARKGDRGRLRSPKEFKEYTKLFQEAKRLLDKHKFGHVWHGDVVVHPSQEGRGMGVSYARGAAYRFADVAGSYNERSNKLKMYINPSRKKEALEVIIHELGHRHWRKFMDRKARGKFAKFYGTVKWVSDYARATNPEEEFCDTLAAYVTSSSNLDNEQRERFAQIALKSGIGIRKPRLRR